MDNSYSTGYPFEDPKKNTEKNYAQTAAEAFEIKHNYLMSSTKEYLYGVIECISKAEEPLHHLQSVMLYLLFKKGIPKDKDIIILGEGADGYFGASLHDSLFLSEKFKTISKFPFFHQVLKYASLVTGKGQSLATIIDRKNIPIHNPDNIVWSLGAYGSVDWSSRYFNVDKNAIIQARYKSIKPFEGRSIYDIISILSLFGEGAITQSIWSKLGESHGKILFYPYTNFDLLNYIFSIPWNVKLKKSKNILRNVAHRLNIPDFIITRPKSSFGIKPVIWSRKDGVFETLVPLTSKVFEENEIRRMQSSDPDKAMIFWNILNYSIWKRLCIYNEPLEILLEELKETI
jgi:asparagine synthetase B (glutamine-hydrolysing)